MSDNEKDRIQAVGFAMVISQVALELKVGPRVMAHACAYIAEGLRELAIANGGVLPEEPMGALLVQGDTIVAVLSDDEPAPALKV